ncbi:MAG: phosphoglycerate kinase [bacterium]|nr:phosphoglycerate kinase [bacterium]
MQWISEISLKGKRVLLRADFNVPLSKSGEVADDFRISSTLPTMQYILSAGASLVIMSHLGDPEGKRIERLRMDKVAVKLKEYLSVQVTKAKDCIGEETLQLERELKAGEVMLLENLRFHKEEEENDETFAKELAKLGDIFVNDAFGVLHREHASVVGVPRFLPSVGGFLLQKEIKGLQKLLETPEHPMVAIIGGRKIESKLPVIDRIAELADEVLLGNMLAREITSKNISFKKRNKIVFPLDGIPPDKEYDIGGETKKLFAKKVRKARTVFWSGPLGRYEDPEYAQGSKIVAEAILEDTSYAVAGGGNLLDFLGRYNLRDKFDHISTGGSSMLAFLAGDQLPGLKALGYYGN